MKKLFSLFALALVLGFSSCIEQNYPVWEGHVVEFQDAVDRSPLSGQVYPRITVANLVGAHRPSDEIITYNIAAEGTTAVAGRDYVAPGTLTIPAGSSFGTLTVNVLNTGRIGGSVDLLLQLVGNDEIGNSANYNKVQIRITR